MKLIIPVTIATILALIVAVFFWRMSVSNQEIRLRRLIEAKQVDNLNTLDNMQKKIAQVSQVPAAAMAAIKDIVVGYADARKGGTGSLATMLTEAVPQGIDQSTFKTLINVVTASRDSYTRNQTEILDMVREHKTLITTEPSSWWVGNRPVIEVKIVTSTKAQGAMESGVDDDINLKLK